MVWQKHIKRRNPIQLNKNDVRKAVKKTKSLPRRASSETSVSKESSKDGKANKNPEMSTIGSRLCNRGSF